jgi:hypothetical protein
LKTALSLGIVSVLLLGSCAYRLQRGGLGLTGLGEGVATARVFVPVVDNVSTEVGPEGVLTGAVREALATLHGLEVVNHESQAQFILLGRIRDWGRYMAAPTGRATQEDEDRGGLIRNQTSASDIRVFLNTEFELLEVMPTSTAQVPLRRSLWSRNYRSEANYEAFARFDEASGSSSAPHVNRSRERLQLRQMSERIARQIIDQVSQDF